MLTRSIEALQRLYYAPATSMYDTTLQMVDLYIPCSQAVCAEPRMAEQHACNLRWFHSPQLSPK